MVKIYGIVNPLNDEMLYIGASQNPKARFTQHRLGNSWHPSTYRYKEIIKLKDKNIWPDLIILDEVEHKDVRFFEEFYISLFKSWGYNLTQNSSSGYYKETHKFKEGDSVLITDEKVIAKVTGKRRSYVCVWSLESSDLMYHHSKLQYLPNAE